MHESTLMHNFMLFYDNGCFLSLLATTLRWFQFIWVEIMFFGRTKKLCLTNKEYFLCFFSSSLSSFSIFCYSGVCYCWCCCVRDSDFIVCMCVRCACIALLYIMYKNCTLSYKIRVMWIHNKCVWCVLYCTHLSENIFKGENDFSARVRWKYGVLSPYQAIIIVIVSVIFFKIVPLFHHSLLHLTSTVLLWLCWTHLMIRATIVSSVLRLSSMSARWAWQTLCEAKSPSHRNHIQHTSFHSQFPWFHFVCTSGGVRLEAHTHTHTLWYSGFTFSYTHRSVFCIYTLPALSAYKRTRAHTHNGK